MGEIPRATLCGVLTLVTLGAFLAAARRDDAAAAPLAAPTPAEQSALLLRYKPLLHFQKAEVWPPVKVDQFLRDARLEKQVRNDVWRPTQRKDLPTTKEGCQFTPCFRLNLPCDLQRRGAGCFPQGAPESEWRQAAVFANFVQVRHPLRLSGLAERPAYLLRYSYFYYFDDWRTPGRWLWQVHEGDWETVTIGLSATHQPLFAAYSQHCSGTWRAWDGGGIEKKGDRPVVYVALGSHAHYFRPVNQPVYLLRCAYSQNARSRVLRWLKRHTKGERLFDQVDRPRADTTDTQLVQLPRAQRWTSFAGVWSEGDYVYTAPRPTPVNRLRIGDGPKTPRFFSDRQKDFWHETTS